ncbi:YfgM family protein [Candidatus Enterovibrio altilux]|uniref:Ancillary SecYEG translocon subunit n=1 Tax=Candidatus Enterovibrio altilux TaxID=1927128 RepID=A0A291BBE9_9GAMM|nr:tetratricopeptide repeat protein [Candidatus Enterovibrio luxaltus]ATF10311.1 hypothetical protein BTN50_1891 [Candidatus Enterovibrio luxaltus]
MDVYTTEEQQVVAIKQWWRNNGKVVCLSVVTCLGSLYGWRYFQTEQETNREQTSEIYNLVVSSLVAGDANAEKKVATFIDERKKEEAYVSLASLQLAKFFVETNELSKAAEQFRVAQTSKNKMLNTIASFRLARVEAELKNFDTALQELNKITGESWTAQVEELRGDIELRKGDATAARSAYVASIAAATNPVVQMKLDNLSPIRSDYDE